MQCFLVGKSAVFLSLNFICVSLLFPDFWDFSFCFFANAVQKPLSCCTVFCSFCCLIVGFLLLLGVVVVFFVLSFLGVSCFSFVVLGCSFLVIFLVGVFLWVLFSLVTWELFLPIVVLGGDFVVTLFGCKNVDIFYLKFDGQILQEYTGRCEGEGGIMVFCQGILLTECGYFNVLTVLGSCELNRKYTP